MGMVMLGDTTSANTISSFIRGRKDVREIKYTLLDGGLKSAPKPAAMTGR